MKTERRPYLVTLKPEFAAPYKGKLELDREYQAFFSLHNPDTLGIIGTDIRHAPKNHFALVERGQKE